MQIIASHEYCAHLPADVILPKPQLIILPRGLKEHIKAELDLVGKKISESSQNKAIEKAFNSVQKRVRLSEDPVWSHKAIYQLPIALNYLSCLVNNSASAREAGLPEASSALIEQTLIYLVSAAAHRLPKDLHSADGNESKNFKLVGQGSSYWALSDSSSGVVALVAKRSDKDSFNCLRQRWEMSKRLAPFNQPKGLLIATLPFLHAFFECAPGVRLKDIYIGALNSNQTRTPARDELITAALTAGRLVRSVADLPVNGFGKFIREIKTHADGHKVKLWRGESESIADAFKLQQAVFCPDLGRQEKILLLLKRIGVDKESYTKVSSWYQEIFLGSHRPCFSHPDPHLGNYLYDQKSQKISILDWERVVVAPEPVMLGRIFQFWSAFSKDGAVNKVLFNYFMKGYEPVEQKRDTLGQLAIKAAAVRYLAYACGLACSSPAPERKDNSRNAASYADPVSKLSSILRLIEGSSLSC